MRGSTELSNLSTIGSAISKTQRSLFPKGKTQSPKKKAKQELKKSSGKSSGKAPASEKTKIIKPDHPAKKKPESVNRSTSQQFLGYSDTSHLPATRLD
jgi:hypothetical protein